MSISDEAASAASATAKVAATWGVTLYGVINLHNVALGLAATYSVLQIYVLVRDKIIARRHARRGYRTWK